MIVRFLNQAALRMNTTVVIITRIYIYYDLITTRQNHKNIMWQQSSVTVFFLIIKDFNLQTQF